MTDKEIKNLLDEKFELYHRPNFIQDDPIQIPHRFSKKEDIEISGFLVATIAWGQRKTIINNANKLMELMDNAPHDFIINHKPKDLKRFQGFVHRTFNEADIQFFISSLRNIYNTHDGLEEVFALNRKDMRMSISHFKKVFFEVEHLTRTQKHVSDPLKGSAAKRINMYLRWMIRNSSEGIDFGIWKTITPSALFLPLDVHTGNVSRKLGLTSRKQNNWITVNE
ncbi:MAG TPA: TIGR02757 family protein, partial [Crocinitomicaceae bacterium]|nr:TIGR02757 family protein [Crocinitomicaceae bacterium]